MAIKCRIYAPVGSHEDLLPYLVRRLLENGANSSFVNRIVDDKSPISELVEAPYNKAKQLISKINQTIPLPKDIFDSNRINSTGFDSSDYLELMNLSSKLKKYENHQWQAQPLISGYKKSLNYFDVYSPAQQSRKIGEIAFAKAEDLNDTIVNAIVTHVYTSLITSLISTDFDFILTIDEDGLVRSWDMNTGVSIIFIETKDENYYLYNFNIFFFFQDTCTCMDNIKITSNCIYG